MACQLLAFEVVPMGTYNLTTKATNNSGISAVLSAGKCGTSRNLSARVSYRVDGRERDHIH